MVFHIFESNNEIFKTSSNKSLYSTTDYNDAITTMAELVDSGNINSEYLYLILDFGVCKGNFLHHVSQKDPNMVFSETLIDGSGNNSVLVSSTPLPFLIIAIYRYEDGLFSKDDSIVLESNGFTQEFKDNVRAIEKLLYFEENNIEYKSYIRYKTLDDQCINQNITISDKNSIKRFTINPYIWEANPIKRERKFYNYVMS